MGYVQDLENRINHLDEYSLYPSLQDTAIHFEITNACNHRCIFCANPHLTRKTAYMDDALIYRITREAAEAGVKKIGYFMTGEPFISKELANYIRFSKQAGIEYVFVTTNGALATPVRLKEVFDAGLDSIKFSINAGTPETYRLIHGADDYSTVMENLKYAHAYRIESGLHYKILSSCVVTKTTQMEIEMHAKKIEPYVDELVFFRVTSFAGNCVGTMQEMGVEIENERLAKFSFAAKAPCNNLVNSVNVTCEGYLTICCNDANNTLAVENLHEKSLKEAWHSVRMVEMRQRHRENRLESTQCYNCIHNANNPVKPLNEALYQASQGERKQETTLSEGE